jgi:hypothetical protein
MRFLVDTEVGRCVITYLPKVQQVSCRQLSVQQLSSPVYEVACLGHDMARGGWNRLPHQKMQPHTVQGVAKGKCRR